MQIHLQKINLDEDFKKRLQDAECRIEGLTDQALDAFEEDLSHRIRLLLTDKITPQNSRSRLTLKKSISQRHWQAGISSILIAAAALFYLRVPRIENSNAPWISKGLVSGPACRLTLIEGDRTSPEGADAAIVIDPYQSAYLKSDCKGRLQLQVYKDAAWADVESVQLMKGFVTRSGELVDMRAYAGSSVRIRAEGGPSEELTLIIKSTR